MAEKKVTTRRVAGKTATVKKAAAPKKVAEILVDAENVGFRAGDVYQALSAAGTAQSVSELCKATNKTETEILLGIGWLLKEGKIKGEEGKVVLA